jgi:glycosyltransferase involved in cell wall biosynthesis
MKVSRRLNSHGGHQCDVGREVTSVYLQIYPSPLVNASRVLKIAKSIHKSGYFVETHVVGVQAAGLDAREEVAPGVSVVRLPGSHRRGNLGRALRVALWQPRVYLHYRREPLTAIAAHIVWVLPLCWVLSRRTGASLVYNAHELETETGTMTGFKQKVAKFIESRLVTKCSIVSVVNSSIADWYEHEYPIHRPVVVGNVPVVRDATLNLRERLGVTPDEMLYVHTGHLVEGRNIPLILAAFSSSAHHVVFLGDGHLREAVRAACASHSNIHWLPPVDHDLIVAHVREADVGLCLIEHQLDLSDELSSPNKLLESLAADTPPLCSNLVEARRLLGPLADRWILSDPSTQLAAALERISKADVEAFRSEWPGATTWDDEIQPLVAAFSLLPVANAPRSGPHLDKEVDASSTQD